MDFPNDDFFNALNDLPRMPLLGQPHLIALVNDEERFDFNAFMNDLPPTPLFRYPHLIALVNDEEDIALVPAHAQPLPVYGPSQIFQVNLTSTRLPDLWTVYQGMMYFGLEEEHQEEDQNNQEEEEEEEEEEKDLEKDLEDEAKQGPIKRPISTDNQSLEDMIKTSGGEPFIATIGLQELNTTGPAFVPTLEPPFSRQ